jgi:HEAT repeat protein
LGLAQETAALPVLLQIAAGENDRLRDIFTRIKAIEALGRLRVWEAADLLRAMLRQRNGLTHAEPAGLRAAAEEALAWQDDRERLRRLVNRLLHR